MKSFDRSAALLFRADLIAALDIVAKKHGLVIDLGKCSFGPDQFNFKGTAVVPKIVHPANPLDIVEGAKPVYVASKEALDFVKNFWKFGLLKEDLGREFVSQGRAFKIVGAKPTNWKMPILAETKGGKRFKFSPETVKRALNRV